MDRDSINLWDIVMHRKTIVQVVGFNSEEGVVVQDIHTKEELTHSSLLHRVLPSDVKWFCENTEHINFQQPNQRIR